MAGYLAQLKQESFCNICDTRFSLALYMNIHKSILVSSAAAAAAAAAKLLQSCPTLCDPIDGSSPGSPVPGILQARIMGWVAISFSNA